MAQNWGKAMNTNNYVPGTSIPKPKVKLIGTDGNAFLLLGKSLTALQKAKVPEKIQGEFMAKAKSGDYDNVLRTICEYLDAE